MDDEAFKLPKRPDLGKVSAFQQGNVHSLSKANLSSGTVFARFVQKVGLIFNRNTPQTSEIKLSGRIRELQTIADTALFDLIDLKKEIKEKVDPDLFALVITILETLIKEVGRLPPVVENKGNTAHQVKFFSRYVDSIEKAKIWIALGRANDNKNNLEQAIIQQIAKEFLSRIDRDIQVIQDYLSHAFSLLELSDVLKNELKDKLMPELSLKILELYQLKTHPSEFSVSSFMQWRSDADHFREGLFGAALHMIDNFSEEFFPTPKKEKENEHLQAILEQLQKLEEKINTIAFEIEIPSEMDENQRKIFLTNIERLEIEIHQLNSNLYLSHKHSECLEGYLKTLSILKNDLK